MRDPESFCTCRALKYTALNKPPPTLIKGLLGLRGLTNLDRLDVNVSSHIEDDYDDDDDEDDVTLTCQMEILTGLVSLKDLTVDLPIDNDAIIVPESSR